VPVFGAGWVTRGRLGARPVAGAEAFSDATAEFELGWTLAETDDLAGAEAAFLRADRLGHPAGATNLGVLLEQRGDLVGAEAAYRRADERGDATGAFNLGSLLAQQGDLVAAQSAFERADERGDPELTDRAHAALAELHGLRAS
jgi:Flp pilus assembly protein TadD